MTNVVSEFFDIVYFDQVTGVFCRGSESGCEQHYVFVINYPP